MSGNVTVAGLAEKLRNAKEKIRQKGRTFEGLIDKVPFEEFSNKYISVDNVLALLGKVEGDFAQLQKQLREEIDACHYCSIARTSSGKVDSVCFSHMKNKELLGDAEAG